MNLSRMVDDCLARMADGESIEACLARYPQKAAELAPLLLTAAELHGLADARLSQGQRLRAKVMLREALAERNRLSTPAVGRWLRVLPVALLLAAVLFVSVTGAAIAASQPGDFVYPLRIVVERAPILVRFSSAGRAAEEVGIAGRRLSDVREYLIRGGAVQPLALNELLARDEAALRRAEQLSAEERLAILDAVAGHAEELAALAGVAIEDEAQARLQAAAERIRDASARLVQSPAESATPQPEPASPTPSLTASPVSAVATVAPTETPVPAQIAAPTRSAAPTRRAAPTCTPSICPPPSVEPPAVPTALPTRARIAAPTAAARPTHEPITVPSASPTSPPAVEPSTTPRPMRTQILEPKLTLQATALPPGKRPTEAVPTAVMPTIVVPTIQVPTVVLPTRPLRATLAATVTSSVSGLLTPTATPPEAIQPAMTMTATMQASTPNVPELTMLPPLATLAALTPGLPPIVDPDPRHTPGAALTAIATGRPDRTGTPHPRRERP